MQLAKTGLAVLLVTLLGTAQTARAQWGDPEAGDTQAPPQQRRARGGGGGGGGGSGVRLGIQGRLSVVNVITIADPSFGPGGGLPVNAVPIATLGLHLIDRLFIGIGFGFYGFSVTDCAPSGCFDEENTDTWSGWGFSPLVSFDVLKDVDLGALYIVGWLNFVDYARSEENVMAGVTTTTTFPDQLWWGLNLGIGVRGNLTEAIGIGTEWGWGFMTYSDELDRDPDSEFAHGIWGTILFDASVGL